MLESDLIERSAGKAQRVLDLRPGASRLLDSRTKVRVYGRPMKVGEVARRAGVNVETLCYYERRGLLPSPEREPSGHRRYDEDTVRFLRAIKEAQAVGFTLAEIGEYLGAARRSERPSETLRIRMASKIG